jgi:hypothetical protein
LGEEFCTSQCGALRNSEVPELLEVTGGVELPGLRVGPLSSFLDVLLNEPPGDSAEDLSLQSSFAHELQGTRSTDVSAYL